MLEERKLKSMKFAPELRGKIVLVGRNVINALMILVRFAGDELAPFEPIVWRAQAFSNLIDRYSEYDNMEIDFEHTIIIPNPNSKAVAAPIARSTSRTTPIAIIVLLIVRR